MKYVVVLVALLQFLLPIKSIAQSSPNSSLHILAFCQQEKQTADSIMLIINSLGEHIELYHMERELDNTNWAETLQMIGQINLPSRSSLHTWQEIPIPNEELRFYLEPKFRFVYESIKLQSLQSQLLSLISDEEYHRRITETRELIEGMRNQVQIVILRKERLEELMNPFLEKQLDQWMEQNYLGEVYVKMKNDLKYVWWMMNHVRNVELEQVDKKRSMFTEIRFSVASNVVSSADQESWPVELQRAYNEYYKIAFFDIFPISFQSLQALEARHHAYFLGQFESDLGSLAKSYAKMQQILSELGSYEQGMPFMDAAP